MWNLLKALFLKWLITPTWYVIESQTAVWNISHGKGGISQKFLFYHFEYSPELNQYRLVVEGENPKEHRAYGDMMSRLATYNKGLEEEDQIDYLQKVEDAGDDIIITLIPLTNDPEDIWKLAEDDKDLVKAINLHISTLKEDSVEIFDQRHNIVATDVGYFGAFYQKNINVKPLEDNRPENDDQDEE